MNKRKNLQFDKKKVITNSLTRHKNTIKKLKNNYQIFTLEIKGLTYKKRVLQNLNICKTYNQIFTTILHIEPTEN